MQAFPVLLALVAGSLAPTQAGINARLAGHLGSSISAAFISFFVGTVVLGALVLVGRLPLPVASSLGATPLWVWTGGALGAFFVASTVVLAPKLGAGTMMALIIAGQMVASLFLDHFGLVGFTVRHASVSRVLGVALLVAGVVLIRK